jgi:TonB family protein
MRPFARCLARGVSLLTALAAASASAQTLGGRVVDRATRKPLQIEVRLVADTAVVARATTGATGDFFLDAPRPALYRVEFVVDSATRMLSDTFRLAEGFMGREFRLDLTRGSPPPDAKTYFEFEVEKQVELWPGSRGPTYPSDMQDERVEGDVLVQFVVDAAGLPRLETLKVLSSTHPSFTKAVREAILGLRFYPAEVNGRKVPQVAQMPFSFRLYRH